MSAERPGGGDLVADIGGTNVRFGIATRDGVEQIEALLSADYPSVSKAARAYLHRIGVEPRRAALAVAGPVQGDQIQLTNRAWSFSIETVRRELGLDRLEVLNDFAALALAVPALGGADLEEMKEGTPEIGAPIALVGPGTGLGVAALVPAGDSWTPLTSEGGHQSLAAQNEREWQILGLLQGRFGHISAERALSGPGLVNLYEAISRLGGDEPESLTPERVVAEARARSSPACIEAVALFSGWLGALAGDLALTLGARGGVYLGGGMLPKMKGVLELDVLRDRFVAKGRFRAYLEPIPIHTIVRPHVTLLGAARALATER